VRDESDFTACNTVGKYTIFLAQLWTKFIYLFANINSCRCTYLMCKNYWQRNQRHQHQYVQAGSKTTAKASKYWSQDKVLYPLESIACSLHTHTKLQCQLTSVSLCSYYSLWNSQLCGTANLNILENAILHKFPKMYDNITCTAHTQPFYCSSGICPGPPGWAGRSER